MKAKLLNQHANHLSYFRIDPDLLDGAQVRSVSDCEARELFCIHGRSREDFGGILFPYFHPETQARTGGRIKLDAPTNGQKYFSEPGCRALFFAPLAPTELSNVSVPVILIESEKSALALQSCFDRNKRQGVFIATGGADGWKRKNGKALKR